MRAYHFCAFAHDGVTVVNRLGETIDVGAVEKWEGNLVMCAKGLHASVHPFDALHYAPGPVLRVVECGGDIIKGEDKLICRERIEIARIDATDILRAFAVDCAARVLPLFEAEHPNDRRPREALEVATRYLIGEATDAELDAARDAAWAAARDAARDAARAAAGAAARAAARVAARAAAWAAARVAAMDAAWDAARDAAGAAAGAAAWAAAWAAEKKWQRKHFATMVRRAFHEVTQ